LYYFLKKLMIAVVD